MVPGVQEKIDRIRKQPTQKAPLAELKKRKSGEIEASEAEDDSDSDLMLEDFDPPGGGKHIFSASFAFLLFFRVVQAAGRCEPCSQNLLLLKNSLSTVAISAGN